MGFIDTHSHLYSDKFTEDSLAVVQRAKENGLEKIILPNIDLDSIPVMHALEDSDPSFFASAMGIHPCDVKEDYLEVLEKARAWFDKRKYVAVGEIGIDLYWDKTFIEQQKEAFKIQIGWAKELELPIIIHARDSFQEIFEIIDELNEEKLKGVFHCFTGGIEEAQKILSYGGFKMGIGGVLTFKKSGLDGVVEHLDLEDLILETDAPYLAPTPFRGKRNESSYVLNIAQKLAEVKNVSIEEVEKVTTQNAKELFFI